MFEMPDLIRYFLRKATSSGTSPKERSMLQSMKLKGVGNLKNVLTLYVEMQSLEFALCLWFKI